MNYRGDLKVYKANIIILLCLLWPFLLIGQGRDTLRSVTVVAGKEYNKSAFHQWLWGKHYRKEWTTPVNVSVFWLDTASGGLRPYQSGGGRQSKSLRLKNPDEKEYVLRSIDKSFGKALPEIYQGTFIETILNDQVSIAHPYAAPTITHMAEAAGIYHTRPAIVYVPAQPALDTFNSSFENDLYLFEQRPDGNWKDAPNFGNSSKIISTEKVLENIYGDNDDRVDQAAFVRARLFDMLISDWGRHEDQWRWATFEKGDKQVFVPIPRDRDQAYTKFDGVLLGLAIQVAGLHHLQTFNEKIRNVKSFNYPARNLDRQMANETTLEDWTGIAKDIQASVTDVVIDSSLRRLPPEVYSISGPEIAAKLKSRRDRLVEYAKIYYQFISKEVDIVGTKKRELFEVKRLNDDETIVRLYKISKEGKLKTKPFYSRVFRTAETHEIRLYGLDGNDVYHITGNVNRGIRIRVIGGCAEDSIINESTVAKGKHKTEIYDDINNVILPGPKSKLHISSDTGLHSFHYDAYTPDKAGFRPSIFYSNEDRLYVSIGYLARRNAWRKYPFASQHDVEVHYSLIEKAFSVGYKGVINQLVGKWNLALHANYDAVRWTNFFGLGNETTLLTKNLDFYRMRTREWLAGGGLNRLIGKHQMVGFTAFYQNVKIIDDANRFVAKQIAQAEDIFESKHFGGLQLDYNFSHVDDPVLPTSGIEFRTSASFIQNLRVRDSNLVNLNASMSAYLPLSHKLSFVVRGGGASLSGRPEIYQYNSIGGSQRLRGYRRNRFYGKTVFYNSAELQWINNFRSHIFNGKAGLVTFFDNGRVWQPGETSDIWHYGYGGGIILAPFNKISLELTYGISKEIRLFHIRFNKSFF